MSQQIRVEPDASWVVTSREGAHRAVMLAYDKAKQLVADGKPVRIQVGEDRVPLSVRQRKFLHGAVLPQIAEQVVLPDGTRYMPEVWKVYFKRLLLPVRWEMQRVPRWDPALCRLVQAKKATPRRRPLSTEELTDKQYSEFIEAVINHAVLELGVSFDFDEVERDGVRYKTRRDKGAASTTSSEGVAA